MWARAVTLDPTSNEMGAIGGLLFGKKEHPNICFQKITTAAEGRKDPRGTRVLKKLSG